MRSFIPPKPKRSYRRLEKLRATGKEATQWLKEQPPEPPPLETLFPGGTVTIVINLTCRARLGRNFVPHVVNMPVRRMKDARLLRAIAKYFENAA